MVYITRRVDQRYIFESSNTSPTRRSTELTTMEIERSSCDGKVLSTSCSQGLLLRLELEELFLLYVSCDFLYRCFLVYVQTCMHGSKRGPQLRYEYAFGGGPLVAKHTARAVGGRRYFAEYVIREAQATL